MNRHVNATAGRLSLRQPQRRLLALLDRVAEILPPTANTDDGAAPALLAHVSALIGMASVAVVRRGSRLLAGGALVFAASDVLIPLSQLPLLTASPTDAYATPWLMFADFVTQYAAQPLTARRARAERGSLGAPHPILSAAWP